MSSKNNPRRSLFQRFYSNPRNTTNDLIRYVFDSSVKALILWMVVMVIKEMHTDYLNSKRSISRIIVDAVFEGKQNRKSDSTKYILAFPTHIKNLGGLAMAWHLNHQENRLRFWNTMKDAWVETIKTVMNVGGIFGLL